MRLRTASLVAALGLCSCNWVFGVEPGELHDAGGGPVVVEGPAIYVSAEELVAVQRRVEMGEAPWASAYDTFMTDVEEAMALTPKSVVDNGAGATESDARIFATDRIVSDCVVGLDNGRHDYCAALAMGKASRDLALAYVMTGDDAYATRSIELIYHFLLDAETGVEPRIGNGGPHTEGASSGGAIEISLYVPLFVYAASFLRGHPHWLTLAPDAETSLELWLTSWGDAARPGALTPSGSHDLYRLAALSAVETFLERSDGVEAAIEAWRTFMADAITDTGEVAAATSVDNAFFHLKPLMLTAQLATYRGADLYGFQDAQGPALERALDTYAPCISGAAGCPAADPLDSGDIVEGRGLFELAHSRYQSPAHLAAVEAFGRPVNERRILGWATLTHGNAFALDP